MDAFALAGLSVLPVWGAWLWRPDAAVSRGLAHTPWVIAAPALIYSVRVLPELSGLLPVVFAADEGQIRAALGTDVGTDLAWAHFCALDLLAGQVVVRDGLIRDHSPWRTRALLLATLAFAPLGLLMHLIVRDLKYRPMVQEPTPVRGAP